MATESTERLVLEASEPMAEAVRRVLREQLDVMLANEDGSRIGDDIEHVHDMRVAVRRMRTAFRLFGEYYRRGSIKRFQKDLRDVGRALGAVRDLDVFNREATRYLRQQPKRRRHDLDPLLAHWRDQRETARLALIAYLDGEPYRSLVQSFGEFVRSPGAGVKPVSDVEPERFLVRDVLSSTVWQRYETVRAYGRVFDRAPMATSRTSSCPAAASLPPCGIRGWQAHASSTSSTTAHARLPRGCDGPALGSSANRRSSTRPMAPERSSQAKRIGPACGEPSSPA